MGKMIKDRFHEDMWDDDDDEEEDEDNDYGDDPDPYHDHERYNDDNIDDHDDDNYDDSNDGGDNDNDDNNDEDDRNDNDDDHDDDNDSDETMTVTSELRHGATFLADDAQLTLPHCVLLSLMPSDKLSLIPDLDEDRLVVPADKMGEKSVATEEMRWKNQSNLTVLALADSHLVPDSDQQKYDPGTENAGDFSNLRCAAGHKHVVSIEI
ncbi:acidic repeat-containing protein-like [Octopus sinensis]|uniref:Acidic repeat-containing protein-like n=1 Tax=Octopus sinensis TaxID=2607531 RepID=A0A6P7SYN8_9MOLL|nr:acidic repeat-containing protein-like [Octopus sinensis]